LDLDAELPSRGCHVLQHEIVHMSREPEHGEARGRRGNLLEQLDAEFDRIETRRPTRSESTQSPALRLPPRGPLPRRGDPPSVGRDRPPGSGMPPCALPPSAARARGSVPRHNRARRGG
jgi:hypothetical protein